MSSQAVRELLQKEHNRDSFAKLIGKFYPKTDIRYKDIIRAYSVAKDAFRHIPRDGGDRYFEHLRAVALILIEYLFVHDHQMIVAALLHDIVEDIGEWNFDRLTNEFGERVSELVWWVTKPKEAEFKNKAERDRHYHQQLHERAPRDAIVIKLADRLHNLVTMWEVSPEKRERKILETENFYLPLAVREMILIHEIQAILNELKNGNAPASGASQEGAT